MSLMDGWGCLQDDRALGCLDCTQRQNGGGPDVSCRRSRKSEGPGELVPWGLGGLFGEPAHASDEPCDCPKCNVEGWRANGLRGPQDDRVKAKSDWQRSATISQKPMRGVPAALASRSVSASLSVEGHDQRERPRSKSRERKGSTFDTPERHQRASSRTPNTTKTNNPHEPKWGTGSPGAPAAHLGKSGSPSWGCNPPNPTPQPLNPKP